MVKKKKLIEQNKNLRDALALCLYFLFSSLSIVSGKNMEDLIDEFNKKMSKKKS